MLYALISWRKQRASLPIKKTAAYWSQSPNVRQKSNASQSAHLDRSFLFTAIILFSYESYLQQRHPVRQASLKSSLDLVPDQSFHLHHFSSIRRIVQNV